MRTEPAAGGGNAVPGRVPVALIFAQLLGAMVDFGALGLTSDTGFDRGKWLALLPGLAFGLWLLFASAPVLRWFVAGPASVLMLWFLWSLSGVAWSIDPRATFLQMTLAFSTSVGAFWYVRSFGLARFAEVFCAAAGLVLGIGLANDLVPAIAAVLPVETSQTEFGVNTGRSPGLTPGVNQLGMLAGLTMLLVTRFKAGTFAQLAAKPIIFGVAALAMVVAGSRSVAACTVLAIAVQYGVRASWGNRVQGGVAVIAAMLIVVGLVGASGTETSFQAGRSFDSLNGRSDVWDYAIERIGDSPIIGFGMMTGETIWDRAFSLGRTTFDAGDSHNTGLEILLGGGAIGLSLFAVALLWSALRAWRTRNPDALALLLLFTFVGLTEALVSAAGLIYSVLGVIMALVAVDRVDFPWPGGRGGNPELLLGENTRFEPVGSLA